jgi:hypothetical protein
MIRTGKLLMFSLQVDYFNVCHSFM